MADAVPLTQRRARGQGVQKAASKPTDSKPAAEVKVESKPVSKTNLRQLVTLFCIFLIAVSDFFTNNVIAKCGKKTMHGRYPSAWGVVLQGVFVVVAFALLSYINKYE
jgi:hypothetical protein